MNDKPQRYRVTKALAEYVNAHYVTKPACNEGDILTFEGGGKDDMTWIMLDCSIVPVYVPMDLFYEAVEATDDEGK